MLTLTERDERRFWSKVALPDEQGCMLWLTSTTPGGYGQFRLGERMIGAHRVSYTLAYGQIPEGLEVDHVKAKGCLSRHCVAPLHLEAVTPQENQHRGGSVSGVNSRKTHCIHGHAFDEANTRVDSSGYRRCRACGRARQYAYKQRKAS